MKLEILLLGKTKDRYLQQGISEFLKRLSRYTQVDLVEIKTPRHVDRPEKQILQQENDLLERKIRKGSCRVVLDSGGRQYTSESFAEFITTLENQPVSTACFIIGGPLGLADEQRSRADHLVSLSRMTYTHDMTRLILLEQLYRAYTIKAGTGYHK